MYWKGHLIRVDEFGLHPGELADPTSFSAVAWARHPDFSLDCISEDTNGNRILDTGEDVNNNGSLDPQDPAILIATEEEGLATLEGNGVLTTDDSGSGYFRVVYPVTNSWWAHVRVVARAQALGVEATDSIVLRMPVDADEVRAANASPANLWSPYGVELDCSSAN